MGVLERTISHLRVLYFMRIFHFNWELLKIRRSISISLPVLYCFCSKWGFFGMKTNSEMNSRNIASAFTSFILLLQIYGIVFFEKYFLAAPFFFFDVLFYLLIIWYCRKTGSVGQKIIEHGQLVSNVLLFITFIATIGFLDIYLRSAFDLSLGVQGAVLFVFVYVFLFFRESIERLFLEHKSIKIGFILTASFFLSFFLWGYNLHAKWGIVDDHMLTHYFINNPDGVSLTEIPGIVMRKTEVGKFGNSTINRPIYYIGRVFESMLWQRNVALWYLTRITMFAFSVAVIWWLLHKNIGVLYAGIFTASLFLASYWGWIWGYLGPSENYAMFGCALYLFGFFSVDKEMRLGKNISFTGILFLTVGALIAIGSKENFLFLIFPIVYEFIVMLRKKMRSKIFIFGTVIVFMYSIFILIGIFLGLTKAGGDVYGQNIQFLDRLEVAWNGFLLAWRTAGGLGIFIVVFFGGIFLRFFGKESMFIKYKYQVKSFFLLTLILLSLFVSQVCFYNGNYPPSALRYSFPGMIAIPLFALLFLSLTFSVLRNIGMDRRVVKNSVRLLFSILLVIIFVDGYRDAKGFVYENVSTTNTFSNEMSTIISYLKKYPEHPVVLDSFSIWNVEQIASIHAYLLMDNVQNPMFLRLNFPLVVGDDPNHAIDRKISHFLSYVALGGNCGFVGADWTFLSGGDCDQWIFHLFSRFDDRKPYLSIVIDEKNAIKSELKNRKNDE